MATLKFSQSDVQRIVSHAAAAPSHDMGWNASTNDNDAGTPAMILVKDEGIYLMSNGTPNAMSGENSRFVAYAKGYDPHKGDVWDKARAAVGGDDFGEWLVLDKRTIDAVMGGADLIIRGTASRITVVTEKVDEDATREWLADLMKTKTIGYPTNRHKNLKSFGGTPRAGAVVLNNLTLDEAVATYMKRSG